MQILIFILLSSIIFCSPKEINETAARIFQNECSAKKENLVHWKEGEEFLSLGIGHFIWFWDGLKSPFDEQFPRFIEYCKKERVPLIALLDKHQACPWKSREEFLLADKKDIEDLTLFLLRTRELQARFMFDRLMQAMEKLTDSRLKERFLKVAKSRGGMYALIDYVNFKGEGVKPSERYKLQGWGLHQVLEEMDDTQEVMSSFRQAAKRVLARRVANAPAERNEGRWLQGWYNRIDTYNIA